MTRLATLVAGLLLAAGLFVAEPAAARDRSTRNLNKKRHEAAKRWEPSARAATASGVQNITFSNPKASRV
jgi:hypothetical protein